MTTGIITFCTRRVVYAITVTFVLLANPIHAQSIRLPDGQAYTPERFNKVTLEAVINGTADRTHQGARLTFPKIAGRVAFFADYESATGEADDIAVTTNVDYSGNGEGFGVYIETDYPWRGYNWMLRLSRNKEKVEVEDNLVVGGQRALVELRQEDISGVVIISPEEPILGNSVRGFMALGATRQRADRQVSTGITLIDSLAQTDSAVHPHVSLGLSTRIGIVDAFGVIQYEDSLSASAGLRIAIWR